MTNRDKLYSIGNRYHNLLAMLESDNIEEIDEALKAALDEVGGELQDKVRAMCRMLRQWETDNDGAKVEVKRIRDAIKRRTNRIDRVKDYLAIQLALFDLRNLSFPEFDVRVKKNPARVQIDDADKLPGTYLREKIIYEPDKAAIKTALQDGETVPGARLIQDERIDIR